MPTERQRRIAPSEYLCSLVHWVPKKPRPIEALIHQESLAHNIRRIRECVEGAKVFAVVKANA